jgi:cleavage and polyadenylation specificity factor subunit 2
MFDPESKKKAAAAAAASSRPEKEAAVAEEAPSKIESMDLLLSLNASVRFIDLEGKSDGKSLRTVIHSMLPRSAIFVRGEKGHLEVMKQFALTELLLTKVHAPDVGQTVDASSDAQMYSAWLQDLLRARLQFHCLLCCFWF